MSNLVQRIIMFCFFIPLIIALILFMPAANHLALQVLILVVSAGLALETARVFGLWPWRPKPGHQTPAAETKPLVSRLLATAAVIGCGLSPLAGRMLAGFGLLPAWIIPVSFIVPIIWIFTSQVVQSQRVSFEWFSRNVSAYLVVLFYPALGMSCFIALMFLPDTSYLLLVYLGAVFLNDTFAYIAGRLFGHLSPKPLAVSPNKTLVGFIFGFFASPLVIMLGCFFRPSLFPGGPAVAALLGVLLGLFTIVGDLFESGIKRSFGVKDSGTIILGRGGLLDSLDSLIFTAPLFYYGYALLNQFSVM
jgi:phosphatidate cytidylyltransferase